MPKPETIEIGLLGCGTVGTGVARILAEHAASIRARLGVELRLGKIAVRDPARPRHPSVPAERLTTSAEAVARDPNLPIVVEVIGGVDAAYGLVRAALDAGKQVVTANKALLAARGDDLFALAAEHGRDLLFEAAVGGGVPVIRALREALASDEVTEIAAVINGTSNYVLTAMQAEGLSFDEALHRAQEAGYAEADPTLDVSGGDAAQKLAIMVRLAFGLSVSHAEIPTLGIDAVDKADMAIAARLGYTVRPLAVARLHGDAVEARVHPALVPSGHPLASVRGAFNAVHLGARALGSLFLQGQGAGMMPTAVSVVSDIVEAARNLLAGTCGRVLTAGPVHAQRLQAPGETSCAWYVRLELEDRPGALAEVAAALSAQGVSIGQMQQTLPDAPGGVATLVILTHHAPRAAFQAALEAIGGFASCRRIACALPVEFSSL